MDNQPLPRLDDAPELRAALLKHCRLARGEVWRDPAGGHRVGCLDAASLSDAARLMDGATATLALHDPPYNLVAFEKRGAQEYIEWCSKWIAATQAALAPDSSLYVWLGADQTRGFQPLRAGNNRCTFSSSARLLSRDL